MPTPTYTALANVTIGSNTTSITFSSIPQTYRDLILVCQVQSASSQGADYLYFNSDTTQANYSWLRVQWDGSSPSQATGSDASVGDISASSPNTVIMNIFDYSATDKHKTFLTRSNNAGNGTTALANRWANTAAVTSVQVIGESQNIRTGSTISLYGVIA